MVAKSIKASIFWQGSNVAGIAIIQIVYYALLARILSPEDFGLIAIAQSFLNLATLFAQVGIGPALVQHRNPKNAHLSTAFWSHCGLGLLLYVLTFISASSIGSFFDSDALAAILPILTIGFLFSSASASSLSMIQRSMDFRFLFIAENISFLAGMSTGLSLAYSGYGVWAIVYGTLAQQATMLLFAVYRIRIPLGVAWSASAFKELFHFGAGLTLIRMNNYLTNSGVNLLLGRLMSLDVLGLFERSYRTMMIPGKLLGDVIDKVMFPAMSQLQDDEEVLTVMYERNLSYSLLITLPLGLWLSLHAEWIVEILLGTQWMQTIPALEVLFLAVPIRVTMRLTDSVIRAKGLVYQSAARKFLYTVVLFAGLYWGSNQGLIGLSGVILGASIFQYINMSSLAVQRMHMSWAVQWRPFLQSMPTVVLFLLPSLLLTLWMEPGTFGERSVCAGSSLITGIAILVAAFRWWPSLLGSRMNDLVSVLFSRVDLRWLKNKRP